METIWKVIIFYSAALIILIALDIQSVFIKAIIGVYLTAHIIFGPLDWYFLVARCKLTGSGICILPLCRMKIYCYYKGE